MAFGLTVFAGLSTGIGSRQGSRLAADRSVRSPGDSDS